MANKNTQKFPVIRKLLCKGRHWGAGALGIFLLEWWGIVEFALFAAMASGIATFSYVITPYHRQVRQSHKIPFMNQVKGIKVIFAPTANVLWLHTHFMLVLSCTHIFRKINSYLVCRIKHLR